MRFEGPVDTLKGFSKSLPILTIPQKTHTVLIYFITNYPTFVAMMMPIVLMMVF